MSTVPEDELVQQAFAFLVEEAGFTLQKSHNDQRETSVVYTSETARVSVLIDYLPVAVNVYVGLFQDETHRRAQQFHLWHLVQDHAPQEAARLREPVDSLEQALALNAELLRRYAADLLSNDRDRVAGLRRLRADEARRRNKEEFGTSTGETPRFSERPTLEQLFSDADDEGLQVPRAYQAHWDYGYSLAEIAEFLDVKPERVQAMLDQWDMV